MDNTKNIRNFAIVAHIDHGKSTLADRLLEVTGTIEKRLMHEQYLDSNPIERERGITIKLAPVRMIYKIPNPKSQIPNKPQSSNIQNHKYSEYILNLIDTPGHVDFSYEVSRSLMACEGILLVVDASQGIQAQTVAHMQLIRKLNLKVIPVINKIDLPIARIEEVKRSLISSFEFKEEEILLVSAKKNLGIDKVLSAIISRIAPPKSTLSTFRGLVFSSIYDKHRGVVVFVRITDGQLSSPKSLKFLATETQFTPIEFGVFTPSMQRVPKLSAGEVGYIATGLKEISLAKVGDTITESSARVSPLPGFKEPKPMVFVSLFPVDNNDFLLLRQSLEKLHLSDSSYTFQPQSSAALGKGYLCGFLGLLHAEIIRERLSREFNLSCITTSPTVEYELTLTNGDSVSIKSPQEFPDPSVIREIREPVMYATIITPVFYVGDVMTLVQDKRGVLVNMEYVGEQATFTYVIPLSEMITDFYDRLKSLSSGYASLDYEYFEHKPVTAVKLTVLVNKSEIDAFCQIVVSEKVQKAAINMVERLKNLIPRHQFQIPIQAALGGKVIARSDVKGYRKDVTQKLYGGDRTRKDKLLDAQKKGKKRMKQFGKVEIPQEVFLEVFKSA